MLKRLMILFSALMTLTMVACIGGGEEEETPVDPGVIDPGTNPGVDPGTDPGVDPGVDPITSAGKMHRMGFVFLQTLTTESHVSNIDFPRYTILTLFSLIPNDDGSLNDTWIQQRSAQVELIKQNAAANNVKLWISVGGAGLSKGFEAIAANQVALDAFVENVVNYAQTHGYEGVDLDWEYPRNATEAAKYAEMLSKINAALPAGKTVSVDAPTYVHSFVKIGSQIAPRDAYNTEVFNAVDYFNIMAYDMDITEGEVARYTATEATVNMYKERGLDMSKALLGVPFYGRDWTDGTKKDMTWSYYEGWKDLNTALLDQVYFTSEADRIKKVDLMINNGMAGVMYWEVTHDVKFDKSVALATFWDEQLKARGK